MPVVQGRFFPQSLTLWTTGVLPSVLCTSLVSYPLDHSPVIIELSFGTLLVPVASFLLRSTNSSLKALQKTEKGIVQVEDDKMELLNKWRL